MEKREKTQNLLLNFKGVDITASHLVTAKWAECEAEQDIVYCHGEALRFLSISLSGPLL